MLEDHKFGVLIDVITLFILPGTMLMTARQAAAGGDGDARSRWEALKRSKFLRVVITDRKTGVGGAIRGGGRGSGRFGWSPKTAGQGE
jgi:hypothetical protein